MQPVARGERARPTPGWLHVRRIAFTGYAVLIAGIVIARGLPTARLPLAAIIVGGLLLTSIGHGRRQSLRVLVDWLPFTAVLLLYDHTRALADRLGVGLHQADVLHAEQWLFGGTEPTLWLQHRLYDPAHVRWYDFACTVVYTSHFLATPILAAVLWVRDRQGWLRYVRRVMVLSIAGLITYCLFPEAPPWLAANDGLTAPVARLSARGWQFLDADGLNATLAHAQSDGANPVAAMPSLHTAFATLIAIVAVTRLRSRWRWLAVLYPVAMGFALVYTGEHWVIDIVAGVAYALVTQLAVTRWERRTELRRVSAADLADRLPAASRVPVLPT